MLASPVADEAGGVLQVELLGDIQARIRQQVVLDAPLLGPGLVDGLLTALAQKTLYLVLADALQVDRKSVV